MKILVIVDMQNDFITGSLGNKYAKDVVIPNVVKKIKSGDYDNIIFTADTHYNDYLETLEGKKLPVKHCIYNTEGWKIAPEILELINLVDRHPEEDDKDMYSLMVGSSVKGFENKKALLTLKYTFGADNWDFVIGNMIPQEVINQDLEIEICGLCTDICVVSNALILRANYPNAKIVCDSSCCGGTSKEAHDAALTVMKSCQIDVV